MNEETKITREGIDIYLYDSLPPNTMVVSKDVYEGLKQELVKKEVDKVG